MAWFRRAPEAGVIFHSDRGSQYCGHEFQAALACYELKSFMSRKGDCWDHAPTESFWGRLKVSRLYGRKFETRRQAMDEVIDWMTFMLRHCTRPAFALERLRKAGSEWVYRCAKQHSEPGSRRHNKRGAKRDGADTGRGGESDADASRASKNWGGWPGCWSGAQRVWRSPSEMLGCAFQPAS